MELCVGGSFSCLVSFIEMAGKCVTCFARENVENCAPNKLGAHSRNDGGDCLIFFLISDVVPNHVMN